MMGRKNMSLIVFVGLVWVVIMVNSVVASQDYGDALSKCILFFEGQRSGKLPPNQRVTWRKDSALHDGSDISMDLTGGYYDAGDNVKFNFPMAFTTTMLAWSVIEFGHFMGPDLPHALDALKWGSDYFLKATARPDTVVAVVGDPNRDHDCWERPEEMDTLRTTYAVNKTHPGSEVSAEIAAALASSSMVFKGVDDVYSKTLLGRAVQVFEFADKYQGSYNLSVGEGACPFYCDFNGYKDELVWGAAWLYKATRAQNYLKYAMDHVGDLYGLDFGWDSKIGGIYVLLSAEMMDNSSTPNPFVTGADTLICSVLPESPSRMYNYSQGGMLINPSGSNLEQATDYSFLLTTYAGYMKQAGKLVQCGNFSVTATAERLVELAKTQVDYLLGKNPLGMSYMVGYGNKFPERIHHRGSSLPSMDKHPEPFKCHEGGSYIYSEDPNPNLLIGAIVGGPDNYDQYNDTRIIVSESEPTTAINAPFVGALAFFKQYSNCADSY